MLIGHIDQMGRDLYVKYSETFHNEPTRQTFWWKIERVARSSAWPTVGDQVISQSYGWTGPGYTVHFSGSKQAEKVECAPVPCPPTRGKPTRWRNGRWEKELARGWVAA